MRLEVWCACAVVLPLVLGLGSATLIAIYDYLGYYDICYIGDEVRDPARVIRTNTLALQADGKIVAGGDTWRRHGRPPGFTS
jgi:hypothetical protein